MGRQPSQDRLEGNYLYVIALNLETQDGGWIQRISMDGLDVQLVDEECVQYYYYGDEQYCFEWTDYVSRAHHDLTVIPGGGIVFISGFCGLVEWTADGGFRRVLESPNWYEGGPLDFCYSTSLHYRATEDDFTLGDPEVDAFFAVNRDGANKVLFSHWLTSSNMTPFGGHHVTSDGHILIAGHGQGYEYPYFPHGGALEFDLATDELLWNYGRGRTADDVQRLANGHTLVSYFNEFLELDGDTVVSTLSVSAEGPVGTAYRTYFDHRASLYGPPDK